MKNKYFNKRSRRRLKINLRQNGKRRRLFSKRMGGVIGASVILENRNVKARDLSSVEKEV